MALGETIKRGTVTKVDERISSRRRFLLTVLTSCVVVVFVSTQVSLIPIPPFSTDGVRVLQSLSNRTTHTATAVAVEDDIPPPLSPVIVQPSGPVHLFTAPDLLTYYEDILPDNHTKLYLVTGGIMMSASKRDFQAVACKVGDDIYPAFTFIAEILICEIPRRLTSGEHLAAVLSWDDKLQRATEGPVKLATGIMAELHPGDIEKVSDSAVLHGELEHDDHEDFRVARSSVHVGPSDNFLATKAKYRPRYRLCLMTMVAPNSHMLKDWADYHRRIGVDQVYIFDNGAELDLAKMFKDRVDVEIISWPYHKTQRQAFSAFLFTARRRCERIFMEDSDEYAMFGLGEGETWRTEDPPLIRYAKKVEKEGYLNYKLVYILMVNSGFLHRPKGPAPMNYIHKWWHQPVDNGKSICYSDLEWECGAIHYCGRITGGRKPKIYMLKIKEWGEVKMTPEEPDDPPFLMHFRDRSWEEYVEKWNAGRVSGKGVADKKAGTMTMDNPDKKYMAVDPSREYTHFRDSIYPRVVKEGTLSEQTLVLTKNGRRCERLYKIDKARRTLMREICSRQSQTELR